MQAVGQGEELGGGFSEGGLRFGDLLAAVDDGRQLGRTAVAQVDQPGFVRDVVFLLERDQRVEAGRSAAAAAELLMSFSSSSTDRRRSAYSPAAG